MSFFGKIKGWFASLSGKSKAAKAQPADGEAMREVGAKKEPMLHEVNAKKTKEIKRRDVAHIVVMFLLILIALVMFSEATLALLNFIFWDNQLLDSFITPIAIMPALAIVITGIIIYINNETNKASTKFIQAIDKVSHGEFGYQLEVPKKGQFKELYENFNKMSKELSSIQTLKDEFIHDFSHEFKTPIASINGFANLLLEGGLSEEEQRQYLKIIADESARLSGLAESTLMLNRLENQQFVGEVKPYRLDLQIKECVILLEREWSAKDLVINSELPPVTFEGNATLMQQVWLNLLSNAIKFTPHGGEISLFLSRAQNKITVKVADTGIGMSDEVAAHVFDKYYQGDKSHATRGNGLGLAIVKRIITLTGGTVSVESKENAGSTFTVCLPA